MSDIETLVVSFREHVDRDFHGPFSAHLRKHHDVPAGRVVDLTVFTNHGAVDFEKVPVHDSGQEIVDVHPEIVAMPEYDPAVIEKVEAFAKKRAALGSVSIEQAEEGATPVEGEDPEVDEERPTPEPPVEGGGEVQPGEGGTHPVVE